ncbi:adhesin transport system outer membrane protein [Enterobacter sp. BIGb0383]|uniref:TolC family protein n=1 Tax=unclassified Enterobacter TaxID=2608935 RepID=UPI000F496E54|nr:MULTISPECIES: TolC family protein [unclassified Enterobacter]ROP59356.1 adhesin transport system outer membrane protein [Enterobacter sp. BIGb0383]ROS09178.1 adhesin transport system outer membrane protein [Enterobacter sp. BIGb0359]
MRIYYFPDAKICLFFAVFACATYGYSAEDKLWPVTFNDGGESAAVQHIETAEVVPQQEKPTPVFVAAPAAPQPVAESTITVVAPARRQDASSTSLWDAVALAVKWHPLIKRAEQELAQSQEAINEAEAGWLPSLSAGVKSGFEENQYSGRDEGSSALVLSASQLLYDFGKTESKVGLANTTARHQASSRDKSVSDIAYETVSDYLQAVRYQRLAEIAATQVTGFSTINEIARKRASLGASAQSDYSQSKVRLASSVAAQHDYQAQANRWSAALDSITNSAVSSRLSMQFPDGMEGICRNTPTGNITSPTIAMAHAQIDMARDRVAAAKADYYPTLSLDPSYEYQLDDDSTSTNRSSKKGRWGVFINVSVPLYEGGSQVSRTRQSEQVLQAAQYNLDREKTDAVQKLNEATSQIASMQESLVAKKTREGEALQTRDLYKMQYIELGNRSFSDLLTAEAEIHQTRMDIVNQSYTMTLLSVECLYYSGQLADYFIAGRQ